MRATALAFLVLLQSSGMAGAVTPEAQRILDEVAKTNALPKACSTPDQKGVNKAVVAAVKRIVKGQPRFFGAPPKQFAAEAIDHILKNECS